MQGRIALWSVKHIQRGRGNFACKVYEKICSEKNYETNGVVLR